MRATRPSGWSIDLAPTLRALSGAAALAAALPAVAAPPEDAAPAAASAAPAEAEQSALGVDPGAVIPEGQGPALGAAHADPRRLLPHSEFLEDSYLDYFFPNVGPVKDKPLTFDAQAALHLFLWNQWWKVYDPAPVGGWRFVNSLAVTFVLKVRMVQEYSAPVRPPSYLPRLDYQLFAVRRTRRDLVDVLELRLTPWGHHSNGQQNCEFATGASDPKTLTCVDDVSKSKPPTPEQVNYRSGDFSTSYFIAGVHWARIGLDDDRWTKWRAGLGLLFEGNPRPWGPGTISATESDLYGPWRLKLEGELRRRFDFGASFLTGMGSLTGSGELMWTTAAGIPGDREIAEVAYQPDVFRGMGAFVRYFSGQDAMNVLYAAGRTRQLLVGIVWSGSPQLQYTFGGP